VDWLIQASILPPRDLYVIWRTVEKENSASKVNELPPEVALLKEHLPKDQLVPCLNRWQKASKDYVDNLINFKQIAAAALKQEQAAFSSMPTSILLMIQQTAGMLGQARRK